VGKGGSIEMGDKDENPRDLGSLPDKREKGRFMKVARPFRKGIDAASERVKFGRAGGRRKPRGLGGHY